MSNLKKLIEANNQNIDLNEIKPNSMQVQALKKFGRNKEQKTIEPCLSVQQELEKPIFQPLM